LRDFVVEMPGGHRLALGERIAGLHLCRRRAADHWSAPAEERQRDSIPGRRAVPRVLRFGLLSWRSVTIETFARLPYVRWSPDRRAESR
jgi:hypothetical protein